MADVEAIRPPVCSHCGWPLSPSGQATLCALCQNSPFQLDGLRAYAFHSGPLRKAIHQLKYEGLRSLAAPLGLLMSQAWPDLAPNWAGDAIVPVPLHAARQRERGYNQAALLARELGRGLRCPVVEDVLVRVKATPPQVGLTAEQRRANVSDAFKCAMGSLAGKRVLLVDDVCTTGATLEAAAAALYQAGTSSVWSYTLARARS
jgi:ComF family protein